MKLLALLSAGIDSPVACYLMLRRGFEVEYIHFLMEENGREKVFEIVRVLGEFGGSRRVFILPHSEIAKIVPKNRYTCIYCKRGMLKVAEATARRIGCKALVTGAGLGQEASKTLEN